MYSGQRNQYGGSLGQEPQSPPLHHPVPQHPIPPLRSPPVPNIQQSSNSQYAPKHQASGPTASTGVSGMSGISGVMGSSNYGQQFPGSAGPSTNNPGGAGQFGPGGFTNFPSMFNDTNTQLGIQVGRNALNYGQEYIGKNINQYVSVSALKYYFQVSNMYVLQKIGLILFPWTHKHWTRQIQRSEVSGVVDGYVTARDDINAPDMYIPVMAFTTYILLCSVFAGLHGTFHPKIMGFFASKAIAFMLVELLFLKLGTYLLSAESSLLDLIAYSGYKFIGITITMLVSSLFTGSAIKWAVFLYTATANSFFLLRSLRYFLLPDSNISTTHTISPSQYQRRIQFLFLYSFIVQFIIMWFLTS